MKPIRRGWSRFIGALGTGPAERELPDEIASHIQLRVGGTPRAGMSGQEARRAARIK